MKKFVILTLFILLFSFTSVNAVLTEVEYTYNSYNGWGYNLSTGKYEAEGYWSVSDKMLLNPLTDGSSILVEDTGNIHHILFWNDKGQYMGYYNGSGTTVDVGGGRLLGSIGASGFDFPEGARTFAIQNYDWSYFWSDTVHTTAGDIDNIATGTLTYRDIFEGTNLITNSDFSNGFTSWSPQADNGSVIDGVATLGNNDGTNNLVRLSQTLTTSIPANNYSYFRVEYRITSLDTQYQTFSYDNIYWRHYNASTLEYMALPLTVQESTYVYSTDGWASFSEINSYSSEQTGTGLWNFNTDDGTIEIDNVILYDLTDLFGSGAEPDLATFETYLDYYNLYKDAQDTYSYEDIFGTSLYGTGKTNLIDNGDFSDGTTGFIKEGGTVDTSGNTYKLTFDNSIGWYDVRNTDITQLDHVHYLRLDLNERYDSDIIYNVQYDNDIVSYPIVIPAITVGTHSVLIDDSVRTVRLISLGSETINDYFITDNWLLYDLTDLFGGVGLEPDLATFEGYLEDYTDPYYYDYTAYYDDNDIDNVGRITYEYDYDPYELSLVDNINDYLTEVGLNNSIMKFVMALAFMAFLAVIIGLFTNANGTIIIVIEIVAYLFFALLGWFPVWLTIILGMAVAGLIIMALTKKGG